MGSSQTKEEVIVPQNALGGNGNSASIEQLYYHASTGNYMLGIICILLIIGGIYIIGRLYRKCHGQWMQRELNEFALRRSASFFRRREPKIDEV